VVVHVQLRGDSDLPQIVHILCYFRAFLDTDVSRIGDAGENRDDRDHDKQFDQCEAAREVPDHWLCWLTRHHSEVSPAMKAKMQWRGRLLDKPSVNLCM